MAETHWMSVSLHHGDCIAVLNQMDDKSVDVVITDPPYGVRLKEKWDDRSLFLSSLDQWLDECHRVAKAGVIWFCAGSMLPHILAQRTDSFHRLLIWNKPAGSQFGGASHNRLWYSIDPILVFDCGAIKQKGKNASIAYQSFDARTIPGKKYRHPTAKPDDLMQWLITHYSDEGDTILDPFMGSGSTGVACIRANRKFIGIEKDAGHFATACNRMAQVEGANIFTIENVK